MHTSGRVVYQLCASTIGAGILVGSCRQIRLRICMHLCPTAMSQPCVPCVTGKSGLARMVAAALARHPLCHSHVVWVDCRDVPTDTLANARAALLPKVCSLDQHCMAVS